MQKNKSTTTYRISGLDCAHCAALFEEKVKELPNVEEARVNFGAAKITVTGTASRADIEAAGAFEKLKIREEHELLEKKVSFWRQKTTVKIYIATILLVLSLISSHTLGEQHLLTTIGFLSAIVTGGGSLIVQGIKNLVSFTFDMRTLTAIAIIGAVLIGEWVEGAVVVILFAVSQALEHFSMATARQSIQSLLEIAPTEAVVMHDGHEHLVPVKDIKIGDVILVKPGQKIALDGIVIHGESSVNQATITGESLPVRKGLDDEVYAGTLNENGILAIRVTKHSEDTTLARIIHLVEEAQNEKAPTQAFIDRFAKYYTPAIFLLAIGIAVIPPLALNGDWHTWIYQGLSTLVVGCPCALVVSTPIAIVTAIGNAAKNGVLIKGGVHLETLGQVKAFAFDKTGTLTEGKPTLTDIVVYDQEQSKEEVIKVAAAIENNSRHPLASCFVHKAADMHLNIKEIKVPDFQSLTGRGLKATIRDEVYYIGSPKLFEEMLETGFPCSIQDKVISLQEEGKTVVLLGTTQSIIGLFGIFDPLRKSARTLMKQLSDSGVQHSVLLTGDNERAARTVGEESGVREVQAELLPEEKLAAITTLSNTHGLVAMVGDGVNDAPALAVADVSIAMGKGADTAMEAADITLLSEDLSKIPYTIHLSHRMLKIIKQNIAFSLGLKLLALCLVIPGWLTLWLAIIADMGATFLVTFNSLRLAKKK